VQGLREGGMSILYTTHYMEEAERLCDRIGIIDEGHILAEGTRRELISLVGELDHVTLAATGSLAAAAAALKGIEGVNEVTTSEGRLEITASGARTLLAEIIRVTAESGASVASVEVTEPDLEAVFLHLTGKALRD
jgi:ABC-2 type transport system ATP-binding protein